MTITVQDIRDYVYKYLDLTSDDIPTLLIDGWIADGDRRLARRTKKLPYFETAATVVTAQGTKAYAMPTVTATLTAPIKDIVSIDGPRGPLSMMDKAEADERFFSLTTYERQPEAFAVWDDQIVFYPTPDGVYSYIVQGYRARFDWMSGGAGAAPDLPEDFHELVREWVMFRAHEHQDDPDRAQLAKQSFSEGLGELIADETSAPPATPIVMNGGRKRPSNRERLAYPWE